MQGKGTKLRGSPHHGQSFALQSYCGGESGQHMATVTAKAGRDLRRRDGDAESQESIIGATEHNIDGKDGVFITRTVQVS